MGRYVLPVLVLAALTLSCGPGVNTPPPGTTPIAELIAAGTCPVEVVSFGPALNPVMPQFKVTLKNISDKKVKMVEWTVLMLAEDGTLLPEGKADSGYAELAGIGPGETIEGHLGALEGAASGRLVIKSVAYETQPPGADSNRALQSMTITMKWDNPTYEDEIAAVQ